MASVAIGPPPPLPDHNGVVVTLRNRDAKRRWRRCLRFVAAAARKKIRAKKTHRSPIGGGEPLVGETARGSGTAAGGVGSVGTRTSVGTVRRVHAEHVTSLKAAVAIRRTLRDDADKTDQQAAGKKRWLEATFSGIVWLKHK